MEKVVSISKMRRLLWLLGNFKIPMIAYVRPKLIHLDEKVTIVQVKLRRRTKNHLKSMYFGALAVGADVTAGLHAFYFAELSDAKISFAFKAVKVEFLKRPTSHVRFISKEGERVQKTFEKALETKQRVNEWIHVEVQNEENEVVAIFDMQISVKVKGQK